MKHQKKQLREEIPYFTLPSHDAGVVPSRGFCVDVGMIEVRTSTERKQLEVDFVANMADRRYYIQSAFAMPDDAKREQESASLKRIDDSFKKIIIVRDDIRPYHDNNGFYMVGLMDFLLEPNLMEQI